MSDTSGDASAQLLNAMGDTGAAPDNGTPPASSPEVPLSSLSPFSQNFLASIPEADRPVVARHMGSWDKGFTQHSQRLNAQLQPYQQLGSADEVKMMKEAFEQLKADPDGFVNQLVELGHLKGWTRAQVQQAVQQAQQAPPGYDPAGQQQQPGQQVLTPQQQFDLTKDPNFQRVQRAYGAMAESLQQERMQRAVAEQEQVIERDLAAAEQKYGPFNKTYALTMMQQGLTMDAAVQAWHNEVAQYNASKQQAPRIVTSSSAPPAAPGPLNTSSDRAAALVAMLSQNQ